MMDAIEITCNCTLLHFYLFAYLDRPVPTLKIKSSQSFYFCIILCCKPKIKNIKHQVCSDTFNDYTNCQRNFILQYKFSFFH